MICPVVVRPPPSLCRLSGCTGSRNREDRCPAACSHSEAPRPIAPPPMASASAAASLPPPMAARPRQAPVAARVRMSITPPAL